MTILEDIQNSAVDSKSDLATVLRKCKVLAARLGSQPLEDWLLWESNGYPDNVPVPDYRVWSLEVKGHFASAFGLARNVPIPIGLLSFISEEAKQKYHHYECRDSIAAIEALLSAAKGKVAVSTGDLAVAIGWKLYTNQNCVQAWAEFSTQHLVELLNTVRNRILDFALAISKENPTAGETDNTGSQPIDSGRVTQIFNTTVYGGAANVLGSAPNSTVAFNIVAHDFSALEQALLAKGVSLQDVGELKKALDSDSVPTTAGSFGPKVSSWMGRMVEKAAAGGWGVGIGAAGNLLSQAIAKYYGLP